MLPTNQVFLVAVLVVISPDWNYFSEVRSVVSGGGGPLADGTESAPDGNSSDNESLFRTPPSTSSSFLVGYTSNNITFMNRRESSEEEELGLLSEESPEKNKCPARPVVRNIPFPTELSFDEMKIETEITAITLNCWGIRFISKDRVPRMRAIAFELRSGKYDFVFLQEVWTTEDYEAIKFITHDVLPYSHYFYSGVIGAGICIFSKSPIKSAFFHQWAVNGYMHKVQHGDWFGGKGIGMVEVEHRGLHVNLYTAHLHAEYDRENDVYLAHRVTQAFDTAKFISVTSQSADIVIVGGDLNTEPGDLAYRIIVNTAGLLDVFHEVEKRAPNDLLNTCETPRNSYTKSASLKQYPHGKRIDYIIFKGGSNFQVTPLTCETPLPNRVPGQPFSYSDHEAVVSRLKVTKIQKGLPSRSFEEGKKAALQESVNICDKYLKELESTKNTYAAISLAMLILLSLCVNVDTSGFLYYIVPVVRVVAFIMLLFGAFMSIIWHRMESHGILAGRLGMLIDLGKPLPPLDQVMPPEARLIARTPTVPETMNGELRGHLTPAECIP